MFSAGIIIFIYNETMVSRALPPSSVDYNWFAGKNVLVIKLGMCQELKKSVQKEKK